MYLQPSNAAVRPDNAKFRGRDVDEILKQPQPFSGKLESTLDYIRDRGTAELWGYNVAGERSMLFNGLKRLTCSTELMILWHSFQLSNKT